MDDKLKASLEAALARIRDVSLSLGREYLATLESDLIKIAALAPEDREDAFNAIKAGVILKAGIIGIKAESEAQQQLFAVLRFGIDMMA